MIIRHYRETNPGHVEEELEEDMFGPIPERTSQRAKQASFSDGVDFESNRAYSVKTHVDLRNELVKEMAKND